VKQTLTVQNQARQRAASGERPLASVPHVVIVSLDPWRDTPSRLSHLAEHWQVGSDGTVLSGSVEDVEATLDAWNVARDRNELTGDVAHPPLVYLLDAEGTIAYASTGGVEAMLDLLGRVTSPAKRG
jgi:cytochrome oxidase Cu insertion factor (SCO1/SenC/PrrC family)